MDGIVHAAVWYEDHGRSVGVEFFGLVVILCIIDALGPCFSERLGLAANACNYGLRLTHEPLLRTNQLVRWYISKVEIRACSGLITNVAVFLVYANHDALAKLEPRWLDLDILANTCSCMMRVESLQESLRSGGATTLISMVDGA